MSRKSGRQRKPNLRYANDLLDEDTRHVLEIGSDDEAEAEELLQKFTKRDKDTEFNVEQVTAEEENESEASDDDVSMASGSGHALSESSGIPTPNASDEDAMSLVSHDEQEARFLNRRRTLKFHQPGVHNRGIINVHKSAAKELVWSHVFGGAPEDILPIVLVRDMWTESRDVTYPSRNTLSKVAAEGVYGSTVKFGIPEEKLQGEATRGWEWYYTDRGHGIRARQQLEEVQDSERQNRHMLRYALPKHKLVIGPWNKQRLFEIDHREVLSQAEAYHSGSTSRNASPIDINEEQPTQDLAEPQKPSNNDSPGHKGPLDSWILNLGCKIQATAWAPGLDNESSNYLAVACPTSSEQRARVREPDDNRNPAFRPSGSYPSSIQIWAFTSIPTLGGCSKLDMTRKPRLAQILCTDWGNIRQFAFCPVIREDRPRVSETEHYLGLLAVLSSDGFVRVLDVAIPNPHSESVSTPQFLHVKSACFAARPPNAYTIHTCLDWLSATNLVVGSANGSISVYSILPAAQNPAGAQPSPSTPDPQPRPRIHIPAPGPPPPTYILSISAAYPSPRPSLITTTSMSGYTTLLSLPTPTSDAVSAPRTRTPSSILAYSPHLRSWLTTDGPGFSLTLLSSRAFFTGISVVRANPRPSSATNAVNVRDPDEQTAATVTAIATSRWHPHVLAGSSGGEVFGTNPLRKVLPGEGRRKGGYVQTLMEYTWRKAGPGDYEGYGGDDDAGSEKEGNGRRDGDVRDGVYHMRDPRPGVSRILRGFKAEKGPLSRGEDRQGRGKKKTRGREGEEDKARGACETIFEEENAVTSLAWGACLSNAGWAAMGFGSGILVVEDLAHDMD
ncbi:MAG: hypothetical protein Q9227_003522 [Pyrenula ochraceoflavens]